MPSALMSQVFDYVCEGVSIEIQVKREDWDWMFKASSYVWDMRLKKK